MSASSEKRRERRAADPEWAEQERARSRELQRERREDPERGEQMRKRQREYERGRYATDPEFSGRKRKAQSDRKQRLRKAELEACGNPSACQHCSGPFTPDRVHRDGRHVDHDHESGAVRQILCGTCNTQRGHVEAALRAGLLQRHIAVIQEHAAPVQPRKRAGTRRRIRSLQPELFDGGDP